MKQKPPYYELDHETRRLAQVVVEWAEEIAEIQHSAEARDSIQEITREVALRLGLDVTPPPEHNRCEVVPLRPFRVVSGKQDE
jgi:hypothetical protein